MRGRGAAKMPMLKSAAGPSPLSQSIGYFVGMAVLSLAAAAASTSLEIADILAMTQRLFGATFICLLSAMVFSSLYCWVRMLAAPTSEVWHEAGIGLSGAVATLALTYTLIGISVGIGGLADQELNPQTVQLVVRDLTGQFSLAFMTTVVGLPLSAALRLLFAVTAARARDREAGRPL